MEHYVSSLGFFPDDVTADAKYGPAMEIQDQNLANQHFQACVEHNMRMSGTARTREEAETIERRNLEYYARRQSSHVQRRVANLFQYVSRTSVENDEQETDWHRIKRSPARPGPSVSKVGASPTPAGFTFLVDGKHIGTAKSVSSVVIQPPQSPRRDRWKPWLGVMSQETAPPRGQWKPWGWVDYKDGWLILPRK